MKEVTLSLSDNLASSLNNLSESERKQVNRLIEETLQPTGGEQIVMAVTLLEKGFAVPLVSKLTRLEETFLEDLQKGINP